MIMIMVMIMIMIMIINNNNNNNNNNNKLVVFNFLFKFFTDFNSNFPVHIFFLPNNMHKSSTSLSLFQIVEIASHSI